MTSTETTGAVSTPAPAEANSSTSSRLNWLRAGVLGANDGVVSVSGLVIGVAAAGTSHSVLATTGVAALAAGALSMAAGEYVSVSTQRDTEEALLDAERRKLAEDPEGALCELTDTFRGKGLRTPLARQVAEELSDGDALKVHADAELGLDGEDLTNPWTAAFASVVSFSIGALIPLLTILLFPISLRIPATVVASAAALALAGCTSARLGGARTGRAVVRNVLGGLAAMAVTYLIGTIAGTRTS